MAIVRKVFSISLLLILAGTINAQSGLYMPLNIQESYNDGVRSYDGAPGAKYWQNSSDYKIKAQLNTEESKLDGEEVIKYHNNSPDSLRSLVIRLYGDIFKKGSVRDWYGGTADMTNGVEIKYFTINGDTVKIDGRNAFRGSTNLVARLKNKIAPGSETEVKVGWSIDIPDTAHLRMGNYGDNFFIAYWYPQISVFDDIDGWDMIDYSGLAEFYNDFNNYDIELTVPEGYIVYGAGEIQNIDEVLKPEIIERYNSAKESDETVKIITQEDYESNNVVKEDSKNVWKFTSNDVTDYSFAVSNNFNWDAASVEVEPGRRVLTMAVYPDKAVHWEDAAKYVRKTIDYMSHVLPGIPYPYSQTTSFCNGERGGGMETPMMANDGMPANLSSFVGLVFHEIAHTYLPFYMGTNERKYAWMDEGWASFFPGEVVNESDPQADYYARQVGAYEHGAGNELEMALMTPTFTLPMNTSRYASYSRPCNAYMELQRLLGKDLFKSSMQEYMNRWHSKHPIPYDYFFTINKAAGEDLSWFWKPWFFEKGYPDLMIETVETVDDSYTAIIKNNGTIPTAVKVTFIFDDDSEEVVEETARVWKNDKTYKAKISSDKNLKSVELGSQYIPDVNRDNNKFEIR